MSALVGTGAERIGLLNGHTRLMMLEAGICTRARRANEGADLVVILFTGRAFDARRHVDAGRAGDAQRGGDVVRVEAA